jgi:hypothetical protein
LLFNDRRLFDAAACCAINSMTGCAINSMAGRAVANWV